MVNLSKVSDDDLYAEWRKREEAEKQKEREEKRSAMIAKGKREYKNRPVCPITGRAYGAPWQKTNQTKEISLGNVHISGNCGYDYPIYVMAAPSVGTYFHNEWTDEIELECAELLSDIAVKFIRSKVQDPVVVAGLLAMCSPSLPVMNPQMTPELWEMYYPVYNEWLDEAVKVLAHLTDEEFLELGAALINASATGQGQLTIVAESLYRRGVEFPKGWGKHCWGHGGKRFNEDL
jgi:hypothetical protein